MFAEMTLWMVLAVGMMLVVALVGTLLGGMWLAIVALLRKLRKS